MVGWFMLVLCVMLMIGLLMIECGWFSVRLVMWCLVGVSVLCIWWICLNMVDDVLLEWFDNCFVRIVDMLRNVGYLVVIR